MIRYKRRVIIIKIIIHIVCIYLHTNIYTYISTGGRLDSAEQINAAGRIEETTNHHRSMGEQDSDLRHSEEANSRSCHFQFCMYNYTSLLTFPPIV